VLRSGIAIVAFQLFFPEKNHWKNQYWKISIDFLNCKY